MAGTKISPGQLKLLEKLTAQNKGVLTEVNSFLKKSFKHEISDLSMTEASRLIEKIKSERKVEDIPPPVTSKQLSLIKRLQDSEERISSTARYLSKVKKSSAEELTVREASSLLDELLKLKSGAPEERGRTPLTEKQLHLLERLYKQADTSSSIDEFLKKFRKKSLEELTRSEAGIILDRILEARR